MWDVGCGGFRMTVVPDEMMGEVCARARVCVHARAVLYYIYVRGDADARADGVNIPLYAVAILCAAARVSGGGAGAHAIGLACGGDFGFA
jgi:hypothetical protein